MQNTANPTKVTELFNNISKGQKVLSRTRGKASKDEQAPLTRQLQYKAECTSFLSEEDREDHVNHIEHAP